MLSDVLEAFFGDFFGVPDVGGGVETLAALAFPAVRYGAFIERSANSRWMRPILPLQAIEAAKRCEMTHVLIYDSACPFFLPRPYL